MKIQMTLNRVNIIERELNSDYKSRRKLYNNRERPY
jgi:hypothetical protein